MITLYGIPNCDTMKKARKWLDSNSIDYSFHNYKKDGVPEKELDFWVKNKGWEIILNRRGTTWRKLDDSIKDNIDKGSAIQIMVENPSAIKRPVLVNGKDILVGFSIENYQNAFKTI